jgi:hypothetical protein
MPLDCASFVEFTESFGDTFTSGILSQIEDAAWSKQDVKGITFSSVESLDREGGNFLLTGSVEVNNSSCWFKIESGNWNGTVVREWEMDENWRLFENLKKITKQLLEAENT